MQNEIETVYQLERELTQPSTRGDSVRLGALLHADFEECGKSGTVFNKSDLIAELPSWPSQRIEMSNLRHVQLSENAILLKYTSIANSVRAHRCSLWLKQGSVWQLLHHQGTVTEEEIV